MQVENNDSKDIKLHLNDEVCVKGAVVNSDEACKVSSYVHNVKKTRNDSHFETLRVFKFHSLLLEYSRLNPKLKQENFHVSVWHNNQEIKTSANDATIHNFYRKKHWCYDSYANEIPDEIQEKQYFMERSYWLYDFKDPYCMELSLDEANQNGEICITLNQVIDEEADDNCTINHSDAKLVDALPQLQPKSSTNRPTAVIGSVVIDMSQCAFAPCYFQSEGRNKYFAEFKMASTAPKGSKDSITHSDITEGEIRAKDCSVDCTLYLHIHTEEREVQSTEEIISNSKKTTEKRDKKHEVKHHDHASKKKKLSVPNIYRPIVSSDGFNSTEYTLNDDLEGIHHEMNSPQSTECAYQSRQSSNGHGMPLLRVEKSRKTSSCSQTPSATAILNDSSTSGYTHGNHVKGTQRKEGAHHSHQSSNGHGMPLRGVEKSRKTSSCSQTPSATAILNDSSTSGYTHSHHVNDVKEEVNSPRQVEDAHHSLQSLNGHGLPLLSVVKSRKSSSSHVNYHSQHLYGPQLHVGGVVFEKENVLEILKNQDARRPTHYGIGALSAARNKSDATPNTSRKLSAVNSKKSDSSTSPTPRGRTVHVQNQALSQLITEDQIQAAPAPTNPRRHSNLQNARTWSRLKNHNGIQDSSSLRRSSESPSKAVTLNHTPFENPISKCSSSRHNTQPSTAGVFTQIKRGESIIVASKVITQERTHIIDDESSESVVDGNDLTPCPPNTMKSPTLRNAPRIHLVR
jgi:hypothetical protein